MDLPPRGALQSLAATTVRVPIPMSILNPILYSPPFIPNRSLVNIRDLGLVPGSALPAGRIFRSGGFQNAHRDPAGSAWLASHVRRIFDLRRREERQKHPTPEFPGVENVWCDQEGEYAPMALEDFIEGDGVEAWKRQYLHVADIYKPSIRAVLEHVRDRPTEPFLFHCTAGRDRTGVVAGLLQSLAGTAQDDVILDFMLSRIGTEPARERLTAFALASVGTADLETPGFYNMVELRPSSWKAFEEGIGEVYGGWEGYVTKGLGFSDEDLEKIKRNLRT